MAADADYLTDEHIASIAQRMSDEGRPVTPVTVWSELRRGSIVEIATALGRWRDANPSGALAAPPVHVSETVPHELGDSLQSIAQRLWSGGARGNPKAHDQRALATNQRLAMLLAERDEALAEFQRAEGVAAEERRQLAEVQNELRASTDAAALLRDELTAATERAERNQTLVGEMVRHASVEEEKLKAALASLDEQRKAHETLVAGMAFKDEETARLRHEHEATRQENELTQQEIARFRDESEAVHLDHYAARQKITRLTEAHKAKTDEAERIAQELALATSQAEAASAEAVGHAARIVEIKAQLDEANSALETERNATATRLSEAQAKEDELQRVTAHLEAARADRRAERGTRRVADGTVASCAGSHHGARRSEHRDRARDGTGTEDQRARNRRRKPSGRVGASDGRGIDGAQRNQPDARTRCASRRAACRARAQRRNREGRGRALTQEATAAHERIAQLEQQIVERAQGETASQAETVQLTQDLAAARDEANAARERVAQLEQQLAERTQSDSAAQEQLARLTQDTTAARDEASIAHERAAQLEQHVAENEDHRTQHAALQTRNSASEQEVITLQRQISTQAKTYAKDLKQRLDIANEKMVFIDARSTGEVALLRRLSSELERLKPDHELVFREVQQKLIGDKMSQQLAQKGYCYDPFTAVMAKIES